MPHGRRVIPRLHGLARSVQLLGLPSNQEHQGAGGFAMIVLVADDSPTQRALWMYALSAQGISVQAAESVDDLLDKERGDPGVVHLLTARDGRQAIDCLRKTKVDLVVTDIDMPEVDGWEVARTAQSVSTEVPVVIVSSKVETGGKPAVALDGARTYLVAKAERDLAVDTVFKLLHHRRMTRPLVHAVHE